MRRLLFLFLFLAACHASPTTHPPIAFAADAAAPVVVDAGQVPPVVGRQSLLMRGPSGTVLALDPDDDLLRVIDIRDGSIRTLGAITVDGGESDRGGLYYAGFDTKRSTLVILTSSGEVLRAPVRLENGAVVSLGKITKTPRMLDHMPSYFVEDSRLTYHVNAIAFHVHEGDGNSYFALQSTLFGIGAEPASPPFHFVAGKQPHGRPPSRMRPPTDGAFSPSVAQPPPPPPPPPTPPRPLECVQWIGSEDDHTLILLEYNFAVRRLDLKTKRVETIVPPQAGHDCGNWETPVFMLDHSLIVPHDGIRIDLDTKMTTIVTSFVAIVDAHSFAVDDNHDIWAARERMIVKLDGKTFAITHQIGTGAKN